MTQVKRVIKLNEHFIATKLLDRVCNNIKLFPQHDVVLMTAAIKEVGDRSAGV